jgi:hypothetical protein
VPWRSPQPLLSRMIYLIWIIGLEYSKLFSSVLGLTNPHKECLWCKTLEKSPLTWQDEPTHFNVALGELRHILRRRGSELMFTVERLDNLVSLTSVIYHHWDCLTMLYYYYLQSKLLTTRKLAIAHEPLVAHPNFHTLQIVVVACIICVRCS